MMRIITGKARGVRLTTLAGDNTRPTSERAKEAVFSMLQFDLNHTNVLDLFAGSGQMGLEALSRGADTAVLCDRSREAVEVIRANATKTKLLPQCEIACADFYTQLKNMRKKKRFDIVFLDPPYALGVLPQVLQTLCLAPVSVQDGFLSIIHWVDSCEQSLFPPQISHATRDNAETSRKTRRVRCK